MTYRRCFRNSIYIAIALLVIFLFYEHYDNNFIYMCEKKSKFDLKFSISQSNLRIKRHLLKALRYTRSQRVREEILGALSFISISVSADKEELKFRRLTHKDNDSVQDVCLDKYLGRIDHPLYNKGQGEIKCKKKAFEDVLTFVSIFQNCREFVGIIEGIRKNYNKSKIIFGMTKDLECEIMDKDVTVEKVKYDASGILRLLSKVNTDYVLLAHNIYHFDNQSKVERLVQMISYTDTEIAAGGVRLENGQYNNGCYQMAMKMYTLKLIQGYDMSFNSCLYCDYSPAPFVSKTKFLVERLMALKSSKTENDISIFHLFTNMMVNQHPQILVCPDVLFHVKPYDLSNYNRRDWFPFVSWFSLNRLLLNGDRKLDFSCDESNVRCSRKKGIMVPLCCMKELSDSLKFMNRLLEKQNVTFEVLEGTVMGGLKFKNILFWELDADTNFRVHDIDRLEAKLDAIKQHGYSMQLSYECPYKRDHEKCRHAGWHGSIYYAYRTENWRTEMYGVTYILSDFRGQLKEPTRINIDGEWYITYTNPVLYARNIYGGDVFQHVEHASALGLSDAAYVDLFRGAFTECPQPGFHGCLNNFVGEGGLQFQDIYV